MKIFVFIILFLTVGFLIYRNKYKSKEIVLRIDCPPGTAGEYCQYSDIDNCNGRGKVIVDSKGKPICKCLGNFDGNNCEICKSGYGGYNCEYSDMEICKGRGKVAINNEKKPICVNCINPFDGRNCEKCLPGYGGKDCNVNDTFCSDDNGIIRGKITTDQLGNPQCKCERGYFGKKWNPDVNMKISSCNFTTSDKCNGRGYFDNNSQICTECMDGYKGKFCEIDEILECGTNGYISSYEYVNNIPVITCECSGTEKQDPSTSSTTPVPTGSKTTKVISGYGGSKCQFNSFDICKGKGDILITTEKDSRGKITNEIVKCTNCVGNLTGDNCEKCKPGFYGKSFDCKFSNSYCNDGGIIVPNSDTDFTCKCNPGDTYTKEGKRSGKRCQFLDKTQCNDKGLISEILDETSNPPLVKCTCIDDRFTGDRCERCKDGLKGSDCQYSDETTCNGRGIVNNNGICDCFDSYEGPNCRSCKDTFKGKQQVSINYNNKLYCLTNDYCNNRGTPVSILSNGNVKCACYAGFSGDQCQIAS
jgi:hypothetical protein